MRVLGHGGPAFLGFAVSLRARNTAELGSRNYAREHNLACQTASLISANHAGSPAIYQATHVTGNTSIAHVCCGFYAICHSQEGTRCGSLRSTSPVAGSRTKCMDTVDRSSISARATSAGGRRSCVTRAPPDHPLEVCSVHRDQDQDQTRLDAHQHVDQRCRGAA